MLKLKKQNHTCTRIAEFQPRVVVVVAKRLFIEDLGGISLVVECMHNFPNSASVQACGCWLLELLVKEKKYHSAMMKEGAVAAVGKVMQKFSGETTGEGAEHDEEMYTNGDALLAAKQFMEAMFSKSKNESESGSENESE